MFIGQGLIEQSELPAELTYYIGDSKYYKRTKNDRTNIGAKSIYKQYTYSHFLYIVSLYGRDNKSKQAAWRDFYEERRQRD